MKKKRFLKYIKDHKKPFLFCLYLGTIINIFVFLKLAKDDASIGYNIFLALLFLVIYCVSYGVSLIIEKILRKINIKPLTSNNRPRIIAIYLIAFSICMSIGILWLVAYCPGSFTADSINQYTQAMTNNYNDWHPVLHTLLFFKLPLSIFGAPHYIVLFQIFVFSLVMAYTTTTIYSIAGRKWSILFFLLVMVNPIVLDELMAPWKDVGFAIIALLITTIIFKKIYNKKPNNKGIVCGIILGLLLSICTIMRHNGLLFTVPVIIASIFLFSRKQWVILLGSFILTLFIVKVPLYSALKVEAPDKRTVEIVGLPLTTIANVAKYSPQSLSENTLNYLYQIAPQEAWENDYYTGDFNSIKFHDADLSAIENLNPIQITLMSAKAMVKEPVLSSQALFELTHVVYGLGEIPSYSVAPQIHPNNKANIVSGGDKELSNAANAYRTLYSQSILKYTSYCGFAVCIIIAFVLFKGNRNNWKRILLCIPVLLYDFGTMLLLSGPETRFFYINFLLYPVIIIIMSIETTIPKPSPKKPRQHRLSNNK